jgi:hypothetical protein
VVLVDSGHAVQQTLDGPGNRIKERTFAVENPSHEYAQRLRDREYHDQEYDYLNPAIHRHQNFSGINSA